MTLRATVSGRPGGVRAFCGSGELRAVEVAGREELEAGEPAPGTALWLYEEAPAVQTWAPKEERLLAEMVAGAHGAPRVSVRLPRADVRENSLRVVLLG